MPSRSQRWPHDIAKAEQRVATLMSYPSVIRVLREPSSIIRNHIRNQLVFEKVGRSSVPRSIVTRSGASAGSVPESV